jgi:hypothetical protein
MDRKTKKKTAGLILFLIGIMALIWAFGICVGSGVTEHYNEFWYAFILAIVGILFIIIGILYFISGRFGP